MPGLADFAMTPAKHFAASINWSVSPNEQLVAFLVILILMWLNALFHAAEAALSSLRKVKIKTLQELRDPNAERLADLYEHMQPYYATCQIGFQVARVGIITAAVLAAPPLAVFLSGRNSPGAWWMLVAILILISLFAFINLVFVELMFRGIARKNPEKWASKLYIFLRSSRAILSPLISLVTLVGSPLSKRLGVGPLFTPPVITEEELIEIVEATEKSGQLIEDEKEMIHSVIEFTDTVAREVMTPRIDVDAIEIGKSAKDVARLIEQTGHTRIPVYEGSIDRIVGIVHAKDLLKALLEGNGTDLRQIMRPPYFIPESKDLHQLLSEFRGGRIQMAIVQDEYGGTAGVVTIEDVVEEIVGEIVDEYDVELPEIQAVGGGVWLIDGRTHLYDVNDEIGSKFESTEFDTIGGYVFGLFGRQPETGEVIESGPWELQVADTDGRRVLKVKAKRKPAVEHHA